MADRMIAPIFLDSRQRIETMKNRSLAISMVICAVCGVSTTFAESPDETALRIILAAPAPIYRPSESTDEELKRVSKFHSDAQLNQFMVGNNVPEEIRVCYAMHLLVERLLLARDLSGSNFANDYRENLKRDHETLATYLKQLNERVKR